MDKYVISKDFKNDLIQAISKAIETGVFARCVMPNFGLYLLDMLNHLKAENSEIEKLQEKLKKRNCQIADLKHRIRALTIRVYTAERILSRFNVLCAGCNSLKEVNR